MEQKLDEKIVRHIYSEDLKQDDITRKINSLHPAEIGNVLEALPIEKRLIAWSHIKPSLKGEVLLEVRGEVRNQLIKSSKSSDLVSALAHLQVDELADLDQKLPQKIVRAVVKAMDMQKKSRYQAVQHYPDNTAGGLMDLDEIAVRSDITINVALRYLRGIRQKSTMPEHLDSIYVVDRSNRFIGAVSLTDLVSRPGTTKIAEITNKAISPVAVTLAASQVAKLFEDRDLISAPVVDENNRLIGRITIDDVVDVIRREGEHMLMTPVGLSEKADVFSSVLDSVKRRSFWLGINLINTFIAAFTIYLFTHSIEKLISLAILMPIVASMGGVVGNQTLILVTRGIALDQIDKRNVKQLIYKEIGVGLLNGLFWGIIVAAIVYVWMHNIMLSIVCCLAMVVSLFLSTCAGTLIPILLNRFKLDPALGGSVILVAITDVIGFFIFLGFATLLMLS